MLCFITPIANNYAPVYFNELVYQEMPKTIKAYQLFGLGLRIKVGRRARRLLAVLVRRVLAPFYAALNA